MKNIFLIAQRELSAYLRTLSGYLIIAGILLINGMLFSAYAMGDNVQRSSEVLAKFFYLTSGCTMFCAILLSMRLLAEERQNGTLQLLYASPVADREIVLGKFLSAFIFLSLFLLATLYIPVWVLMNGKISWGHLACGYCGLMLLGSACVAIGTLGSAISQSQVLAAVLSGVMVLVLVISWLLAHVTEQPLTDFFSSLSMYGHFKPFEQGLLHLRHVGYFLLVTLVALFGATRILEARRWAS